MTAAQERSNGADVAWIIDTVVGGGKKMREKVDWFLFLLCPCRHFGYRRRLMTNHSE